MARLLSSLLPPAPATTGAAASAIVPTARASMNFVMANVILVPADQRDRVSRFNGAWRQLGPHLRSVQGQQGDAAARAAPCYAFRAGRYPFTTRIMVSGYRLPAA